MFCKDCGAQLSEDARFCPNCGNAQTVTSPSETVTPATESGFADKVRVTAKKFGTSIGFIIATICLTFVQFLGLLTLTSTVGGYEYGSIFAQFGLTGAALDNLAAITRVIGMLPGTLIALGLWITFFSCASRKPKVNTSGLTIIFVVNLVQMILSCLALLTNLYIPLAIYTGAYNLRLDEDFIEALALIIGLVILVVFIFVLIYYIKVCTTISNIRNTLKTGVPNKRASRFVAVLCYISGGILILGGIFSLHSTGAVALNGYYDPSLSYVLPSEIFLPAISSLLSAAAQIIFGSLLFSYRRKMAVLEKEDRLTTFQTLSYAEPYAAPVYIPPEPVSEVMDEPKPANEELEETKRWDL